MKLRGGRHVRFVPCLLALLFSCCSGGDGTSSNPSGTLGKDCWPGDADWLPRTNREIRGIDSTWDNRKGVVPVAVIYCTEGEEVVAKTLLHLFGDQSYSPVGEISQWHWTVERPGTSWPWEDEAGLVPSATVSNPMFEPEVPGVYTFHLRVWDEANVPSTERAVAEVAVVGEVGITVVLVWHDLVVRGPDGARLSSTSDLNLHFLHPWAAVPDCDKDGAPDGWFDGVLDCSRENSNPNWGTYDPAIDDDPLFDQSETGETSPQTVSLPVPGEGSYRVGVHYGDWSDLELPKAVATVRVYIDGVLAFEQPNVQLLPGDLWDVCSVEWPSGLVVGADAENGGVRISSDCRQDSQSLP